MSPAVRIGFVPLIDAAPLVAAEELGLFARHGVRVTLHRQIGWANARDKLAYGQLDAAHALLGIPLSGAGGLAWDDAGTTGAGEPLVSVMELGCGGNAITLSKALTDRGVRSAAGLGEWLRDRAAGGGAAGRRPVFAHVSNHATHHYLLREWLWAGGIHPDRDVRLCVVPPPQMPDQLRHGHLDGFCAGDPWNTVAERGGYGTVVATTTDVLPDHPEKVLAVPRRWAEANEATVVSLVKAVLEACRWCADDANHPELAAMLADRRYVDVAAADVAASLALDRTVGSDPRHVPAGVDRTSAARRPATDWRPPDWRMRSFELAHTFPSGTHAAWLAEQRVRWGHAAAPADVLAAAGRCTDARYYRAAAADLGVPCPADDFPPMRLRRDGCYDPRKPT
ncbi:MAG: nitrate transporter [Phycisphaerales bacterium]|nr:nitrate transporter [Phycisphaerales bacterium]